MLFVRRGLRFAVVMSARPKRSASTVAKSYREEGSVEEEEEDEFVAEKEVAETSSVKKRPSSKKKQPKEDEEVEEEEEDEEEPKRPKKRGSSTADLLKSDKWKISSGERVASANGELRLNPSLTTVAFEPVHERQADFAKVVSWNVNGLRSVLGKSSIARWILEEDPLIICLQETKTNTKKKDGVPDLAVVAPGYTTYWSHAEKPGYAGVATLTKIAPISVKEGMGSDKHDTEGRVLTLEFDQFFLINTYWPNSGDKLAKLEKRRDFNKTFQAFVASLSHKHVIVAGDLNVAPHGVDLHNPAGNKMSAGFSKEEREDFQQLVAATTLLDTWRELNPVEDLTKSLGAEGVYTYWGFKHNAREQNKGWRVDHLLVTASMRPFLEKAFIRRELLGSDHTAVGILMHKTLIGKKD